MSSSFSAFWLWPPAKLLTVIMIWPIPIQHLVLRFAPKMWTFAPNGSSPSRQPPPRAAPLIATMQFTHIAKAYAPQPPQALLDVQDVMDTSLLSALHPWVKNTAILPTQVAMPIAAALTLANQTTPSARNTWLSFFHIQNASNWLMQLAISHAETTTFWPARPDNKCICNTAMTPSPPKPTQDVILAYSQSMWHLKRILYFLVKVWMKEIA